MKELTNGTPIPYVSLYQISEKLLSLIDKKHERAQPQVLCEKRREPFLSLAARRRTYRVVSEVFQCVGFPFSPPVNHTTRGLDWPPSTRRAARFPGVIARADVGGHAIATIETTLATGLYLGNASVTAVRDRS